MELPIPALEIIATSNVGIVQKGTLPEKLRVAELHKPTITGDFIIYVVGPSAQGSFDMAVEPFSVGSGGACVGPYKWQFFAGCRERDTAPLAFSVGGRPTGPDGAYEIHNYIIHQAAATMPDLPYQEVPFADYLARRREVTGREFIAQGELQAWYAKMRRRFRSALRSTDQPALTQHQRSIASGRD